MSGAGPGWCVEVEVDGGAGAGDGRAPVELVADALWQFGAAAVEERAGAVVAGFPHERAAARAAAGLDRRWGARLFAVEEAVWRDGWRPWARPVRVGRLLILPVGGPRGGGTSGAAGRAGGLPSRAAAAGAVTVEIDPGRAYGSGHHPSTRLALAAVDAFVRPGVAVLDVGSGSGIVAVGAAALGATPVVAVDLDPGAARTTVRNARRNGVPVSALAGSVAAVRGRYGLVVANLGGARVLETLAPCLLGRVAPGGMAVVSGLLAVQRPTAEALFAPAVAAWAQSDDGWVALGFRLPRRTTETAGFSGGIGA